MKKSVVGLLIFLCWYCVVEAQKQQAPKYVTLEGRQFKDENGNDFYPVVCNYTTSYLYYPQQPDVFFLSPASENDGWCWNCTNQSSCLDQCSANFKWLKEMNFNAIRLFGPGPIFCNDSAKQPLGWAIKANDLEYALLNNCYIKDTNDHFKAFSVSPVLLTDTNNLKSIFSQIDSVLVRADNEGLKVILLAGGAGGDYWDNFPVEYGLYLSLLARHIANDSPQKARDALMAYDLFNEPTSSWFSETMWPSIENGHSKQDVCEHVSMWYDIIKTYDPDHLVTFGGKPLLDLFEFDASVLKIDFYSPHVYLAKKDYDSLQFFQGMIDQAHGIFYWMANSLPMPYMIGEIGFRSKYRDDYHTANQGTNAQQHDFADSTIKISRNCSSSGYSWWLYMDYYWSIRDCFHGVLGWDTDSSKVDEKPIASVFRNFSPTTPIGVLNRPDSYFDPFHHREYFPTYWPNDTSHFIHGHVQDENGQPIANAVIFGWTVFMNAKLGGDSSYTHYTFTTDSGDFTIIPLDYKTGNDFFPDRNTIESLQITAPGCSRARISQWGTATGVPDNLTYVLHRDKFNYNENVTDITFSRDTILKAWDYLSMQNITVNPGTSVDAIARTEINAISEFNAQAGSDVWIYTADTFRDCNHLQDLVDTMLLKVSSFLNQPLLKSIEEIEVSFIPEKPSFDAEIFPNPTTDMVNIRINSSFNEQSYKIELFNELGTLLLSKEIFSLTYSFNMNGYKKGCYFLKISNSGKSINKKLIIL